MKHTRLKCEPTFIYKSVIAAIFSTSLLLSGCGSDNDKSPSSQTSLNCGSELDSIESVALSITQEMFEKFAISSDEIWTGSYRLDQTPILYVRRNGDKDGCAMLINYPEGENLAGTTPAKVDKEINIDNVLRINKIPEDINKIENFDFQYDLYGKKVFLMKVNSRDIDIKSISSQKDWMLFVAHEGMHNYQYTESFKSYPGVQEVESYKLDKEHIGLILLEQAILNNIAKDADSEKSFSDISTSVLQLIAVRDERYEKFPKTKLHDLYQEQHEGTAKYIEHRLGSLTENNNINLTSFYQKYNEIADDKIRDQLAFMRFYFSGSMISKVLDMKGVKNWHTQVENGKSPYEILTSATSISEADKLNYLAQAKSDYSYDTLKQRAEKLAETAAKEPTSIFE